MVAKKGTIKCANAECGHSFSFVYPEKPGKYKVKCPKCGHENHIKMPSETEEQANQKPADKPQPQLKEGLQTDSSYLLFCKGNGCQLPMRVKKYQVGLNHVTCPKCHTVNEFTIEPSDEALLRCQDSACGKPLQRPNGDNGFFQQKCECGQSYTIEMKDGHVVSVKKETMAFPLSPNVDQAPMKLVVGNIFKKRVYMLTKGVHIIGRDDANEQSDFALKDPTVSRRSLEIKVNSEGGSLLYKMTLRHATNPVYHNSVLLCEGDEIYLNYGDTIKLGKTLIKVQKA